MQDLRNKEITQLTSWVIKELKRRLKEKITTKGNKEASKLRTQVQKKASRMRSVISTIIVDILLKIAWIEKKSKPRTLVYSESNLVEFSYNTWWFDSGCTTHIFNTM